MTRTSAPPAAQHLLATLALLLAVSACGDEHTEPVPEVSAADFKLAYAEAQCARTRACCQEVYGLESQDDDCETTLLDVYKGMPDERYDIEQGSHCIAEIKAEPCTAEKHPTAVPSDACARAYRRGNAQPGGACSTTSSCEWPEEGYTQCARGRCLMFIERGEGESCGDDDPTDAKLFSCALGLFCNENEVCVPPAKLGESCPTGPNYGDTCESGALCDRFDTKTCIEAPTVGTACDKPDDCEGLACLDGKCAKAAFFTRHFCE